MAGLPEYQPHAQLGSGPSPSLRPIQAPSIPIAPNLSAVPNALGELGKELSHVAEKLQAGQQTTKVSQALEGFLGKNQELKTKYTESKDFVGAEEGYRQDVDAAKRDLLQDVTDPAMRAQASLQMERYAISTQNAVRTAQLVNQKALNGNSLEAVKAVSVDAAVSAPSVHQRGAALDAFENQVATLENAGWLDRKAADQHILDFGKKVDVGDATTIIKSNPGQGVLLLSDAKMFPALDVAQRGELFHAAYRGEWANDQAATKAPVAEGFDHAANGTLTPEWLASQCDAMSAMRADAFARTLDPAVTPNPKPQVHAELLHQAVSDPEGATAEALTALGDGTLDRDAFGHVVATARQIGADEISRPWANEVRKQLGELVAARENQSSGSAARQASAMPAFEAWLADNPDATRAEAEGHAAGVAAQSLVDAAKFDVTTLPLPKFASAPRSSLDLSHVGDVAGRVRDARSRGEMSDDEFIQQADLLSRWNDALQQISKGSGS